MPVEANEVATLMGLDLSKYDDQAALKSDIEKNWTKRSDAHLDEEISGRVFGKANNVLRSAIGNAVKDLGIEVDGEFAKLAPVDQIKILKEGTTTMLAALKAAKGDGSSTAEVAELQRKYDEAKKKGEEVKASADAVQAEFDKYKTGVTEAEATRKIGGMFSAAKKDIPFRTLSAIEKEGFDTLVSKELRLKFDDEGKEYVTDAEGQRIKHAGKANSFLTLAEAMKALADREKLTEAIPAPQQVRKTISTLSQGEHPAAPKVGTQRTVRQVAAR